MNRRIEDGWKSSFDRWTRKSYYSCNLQLLHSTRSQQSFLHLTVLGRCLSILIKIQRRSVWKPLVFMCYVRLFFFIDRLGWFCTSAKYYSLENEDFIVLWIYWTLSHTLNVVRLSEIWNDKRCIHTTQHQTLAE